MVLDDCCEAAPLLNGTEPVEIITRDPSQAPNVPRANGRLETSGEKMTVDDALCHIGLGRFQYWMLFILGFSYMADAGEVLLLSFLGPDVKCEWNLTGTEESLITTVVFVGMALGAFGFGTIADFFGRKPATIIDIALTAVAGMLSALSVNFWTLVLSRFFVGVGLGAFILVLSMYSEFLPVEHRGKTLSVYQLFWSVGACVQVMVAWVIMPRLHWRGLAAASALPLVVLLLVIPFIPESPRFLIVSGQNEKALKVLKYIAKVNGTSLPSNVQLHTATEDDAGDASQTGLTRFLNQFRTIFAPPLGKITCVVWPIWIAAALGYYSIVILTTAIQADDDEDRCVGDHVEFSDRDFRDILIDATGEIPGVLLAMFTIDAFGRKKCIQVCKTWLNAVFRTLMFGWYGCAASMFCLLIAKATRTAFMFAGRLFIMYLFAVVLVMAPELYPSSCRSFAMGAGNFMSRFGGALSPFLAQAMYDAYGLSVVAVLHGVLFVAVGTLALWIPFETSGRPMADTISDLKKETNKPQRQDTCNGTLATNGITHSFEPV